MKRIDQLVNEWFGLDENWKRNAEISHSFFNQLRTIDKQIKKLSKLRDTLPYGCYDLRKDYQEKINDKRKEYQVLFDEGPRFGKL